jgi:hypothetical protein
VGRPRAGQQVQPREEEAAVTGDAVCVSLGKLAKIYIIDPFLRRNVPGLAREGGGQVAVQFNQALAAAHPLG